MNLKKITKPTLLLDQQKCKANIRKMIRKASNAGVVFRPHFKTHQSAVIGQWFRDEGVEAITVSSVSMANYFALHGWRDICIAIPVNLREIDLINQLASRTKLSLLVESSYVVKELSRLLIENVGIYLKTDIGAHRTGIPVENHKRFEEVYACLMEQPKMKLKGLLAHAGQTYDAHGQDAIQQITDKAYEQMFNLKKSIQNENLLLSWGDTPSCSMLDILPPFDEWRPGNFVFYDTMQYHIGSCNLSNIAVAMACPVLSVHSDRNEVVIHGGAVHFSKDFITNDNGFKHYGYVVALDHNGWGNPIPEAWLYKLSQEHGIVTMPNAIIHKIKPGSLLGFLPIHSCLTVSCMKDMYTTNGQLVPCIK